MNEKPEMPDAVLIAGANGAGKTTFARQMLRLRFEDAEFLNADEIQRSETQFAHPMAAGRELLHRLVLFESRGISFAVETTLSSRTYVRRLRRWRALGYRTAIYFIELPSAEFAVQRVEARVKAGGHAVLEADIRRRFDRGLHLFEAVYKGLPDRWYHWKSDERGLRLIDKGRNTKP